jgi:serine/threonine protein phosphatase PrpC
VTAGFGRPSAASGRPWVLRRRGHSATAGIRAEEGDTERWALRAASVAGVRHRLAGVGNDDAFGFLDDPGALQVVVADGVGSVPGSAGAAVAAVDGALDGGVDGVEAAVGAANAAVAEVGEGATTIVAGRLADDGSFTLARVGDSSAFLLRAGGWVELFAAPGEEEAVPVATLALPAERLRPEVVEGSLGTGEVLLLATDGVADPLRDGPTTVAPALAQALAAPPAVTALIGVTDFSRQGCHDDRTIVAVWHAPEVSGVVDEGVEAG